MQCKDLDNATFKAETYIAFAEQFKLQDWQEVSIAPSEKRMAANKQRPTDKLLDAGKVDG